MNATPPEAKTEYSRGSDGNPGPRRRFRRGSAGGQGRRRRRVPALSGAMVPTAVLAGGILGALLLLAAEFAPLLHVTIAGTSAPIRSITSGSHHSYALVPIALLAAVMAAAVWRAQSRPALLAVGVLGLMALLIALLSDLPDAHGTGTALRGGRYVIATTSPSAGFFLETFGAVVLVATCVLAFLVIGPPAPARRAVAG